MSGYKEEIYGTEKRTGRLLCNQKPEEITLWLYDWFLCGWGQGAVRLLLGEDEISEVELMTPTGILLHLEILDRKRSENAASCAVRKMQETIRIPQMESWFMRKLRIFDTVRYGRPHRDRWRYRVGR